jgi:5-methylcytosine-specific restriction endonuclease McrA
VGEKRSRLQLPPKEYRALCQRVMMRDGYKCRVCKRRNDLHCHHVVFRSQHGDDAEWNLLTICNDCHNGIHIPNPTTGACLVLLPVVEGERIDCNGKVKMLPINGWQPRRVQ